MILPINESISTVILAGGEARRLNHVEKGLQYLNKQPLLDHILTRLIPQSAHIWLNVNRAHDHYQQSYPQLPHYSDNTADLQGPLGGMLAGFQHIADEYLLFVPCDSPFLPLNLKQKLWTSLHINQATIAYAHDGNRPHPTFALLHRSIVPHLESYLATGERRLLKFFQTQHAIAVDFSEQPTAFLNFNTPEDFSKFSAKPDRFSALPLLGITGYSGTGKTTLLEKLIPRLTQQGLRIGLIKHSHHNIDLDKPGKDSYRLRCAGANPTMIICDQRWALMQETEQPLGLSQLVAKLDSIQIDLVLVEGFKQENIPKIQLHRQAIEKPLPELDDFTIATATDYPLARENRLDINNIEQIAQFIQQWLKQ